ncbi:exodeoxyribonuclease VII large subunit [Defluviimonas sp. WL0002]|uniref:Exodeoxyribonuclease 7 large subunit n=1 Tax=Albidovulum marisflavi TaxID=2984159 RepID=A0ABT2ZAM4_9RHOB|nr:exodeoxyribonuclease VII large subunit [Defluviimonas sp. WL0002]MCV2868127.1 exodeoxyribonuclease VII large subunit [Defluviimonas sp. WL0002]
MDLLEESAPRGNQPEYTVSEISGAVKRVIEGEFGHVRVRGEISRVSRPSSGHLYFDLKDDRAVIAAVSWKGQAARMTVRPEEGMEVIAIGRMTTFPGQSKYQLIVEDIVPAGAGALMVMLEKRKAALAAEGLFDTARKKSIPFLPDVIGVVTSPSGAVIRDILHRLRDRFPRRVVIWPVAVQGEKCAPEVAAAILGFNALPADGPVPRPDLIIVARGGGSIEDLWGFNEEVVVRAAAASRIPLISAVGHETDTTLIDYASDRRAPTPTAAAEMAVPVRMELLAWSSEQGARMTRSIRQRQDLRQQRLSDLSRALGRPEALLDPARQRFDNWSDRLGPALLAAATRKRATFNATAARMQPGLLTSFIGRERRFLQERAARLGPALQRLARDAGRDTARRRTDLDGLGARLEAAMPLRLASLTERLGALDRMRQTLGYTETLRRGYAVVRGECGLLTTKAAAEAAGSFEIEFQDGRLSAGTGAGPKQRKSRGDPPPSQGSLF